MSEREQKHDSQLDLELGGVAVDIAASLAVAHNSERGPSGARSSWTDRALGDGSCLRLAGASARYFGRPSMRSTSMATPRPSRSVAV